MVVENFTFLTKPWQHQREIFDNNKDKPHLAILCETGTGKSKITVDFLRYKSYIVGHPARTLIITPNVTLDNWMDEVALSSRLKAVVLRGDKKKRLQGLNNDEASIKIINFEGLQSIQTELLKHSFDCLVIDEVHLCKNPKSIRTKICVALSKKIPYRYILSGTPVLNNALDIFPQYLILDGGETFGTSYFAFRNKYFEDYNARRRGTAFYYPDYRPKPDTVALINDLIMRKAEVRRKEDCLDLPDKVYLTRKVEMSPEQKKAYHEMRDYLITTMHDKAVTASIAVVKLLRLNQIASGYVGTEDHEEVAFPTNPKIELVKELLEEIAPDHKVIIWAVFRQNIKALAHALQQYNPALIYGDTMDKTAEIKRFQKDPHCRICIANPTSAGIGINLVEASYAIYFSYNFDLAQRIQSEARNYRGGSNIHEKITYIDIVANGTIDEYILQSLKNKEDLAKTIISKISDILE